MVNLLYIHGFNSSPQSTKAKLTIEYFQHLHGDVNIHCPQLLSSPNAAIAQLDEIINSALGAKWIIIGSSLGGYFATYLAEKYQLQAVLVNPAVKPYALLNDFLGEQINPYTHERYQVEEQHIVDLKLLKQQEISKKNYLVMVQTGDEVLDYQQAVEKYQHCHLIVQEGGDHSFINYQAMLPQISVFFNLESN